MTNRDAINTPLTALAACATAIVLMTGCSSLKTPATADVAVSRAAVDNAASAGAADLAQAYGTAFRHLLYVLAGITTTSALLILAFLRHPGHAARETSALPACKAQH